MKSGDDQDDHLLTEIEYSAEEPIESISARLLLQHILRHAPDVQL